MGDTLDKREATDLQEQSIKQSMNDSSESREAEQRGMLGQGTIKTVDYP